MIRSFAGLRRQPQEPRIEPSTSPKRRPLNVAAIFAVLLGSLVTGAVGGLVVWSFCELDSLNVRDSRIS